MEAIKEHLEIRREWLLRKFSFEAQKNRNYVNSSYRNYEDDNTVFVT